MSITAKETTKALRSIVYPLLKAEGFDDWTSRSAWRRNGERVEHVNFRSFNSYYADKFHCTPASVDLWIGIRIPEFKAHFPGKSGPNGPRPLKSGMPIRAQLAPSLGLKQRNQLRIWKIDTLTDAETCAHDIATQLKEHGIPWINRSFDISALQDFLQHSHDEEIETTTNGSRLWAQCGRLDSPSRNWRIAELACALGNYSLASERYERARWALNQTTGERFLFRSSQEDGELQRLSRECANRR